jgi:hypothetical protein
MLADITSVFDERSPCDGVSSMQSHFDPDQNPRHSSTAKPSANDLEDSPIAGVFIRPRFAPS